MPKHEHAGFYVVNPNRIVYRPINIIITRDQYDILLGIALCLDVKPKPTYGVGNQRFVFQMVRDIADRKLLVVRPDETDHQPEVDD